jgi:hypothetical protein
VLPAAAARTGRDHVITALGANRMGHSQVRIDSHWEWEANPGPGCTQGWVCMWGLDNFNGERCKIDASYYAGRGWQNFGGSAIRICELDQPFFNDELNSWKNNSSHDAQWAQGVDGAGDVHCMNNGGQNASVSDPNTATSVRVKPSNDTC